MCAGDDTIEPTTMRKVEGETRLVVDGLKAIHVCKDTSVIQSALEMSVRKPLELWRNQGG